LLFAAALAPELGAAERAGQAMGAVSMATSFLVAIGSSGQRGHVMTEAEPESGS